MDQTATRPKCDECQGCPPYHSPSCSQNTQAERNRADDEYRRWYGGEDAEE